MNRLIQTSLRARLLFAGIAGALAVAAIAILPSPAQARVWVSVGGPCCSYYGPGPYYGYGYYPPSYYYAPPPSYYYPPPPAAYSPPGAYSPPAAYPPPATPAPSAYTPPAASATPNPAAAITYTNKPAFTNAAGQTCREYQTANASGQSAYGTACRQADGQWRVVN